MPRNTGFRKTEGKCRRKYTALSSEFFEERGVRVKWRSKSPPPCQVTAGAWQTPSGARSNRKRVCFMQQGVVRSFLSSGRPLDSGGNVRTREMAASTEELNFPYRQNSAYRPAFPRLYFSVFIGIALLVKTIFAQSAAVSSAPDTFLVSDIRVAGNTKTLTSIILKTASLKPGDKITGADIQMAKTALEDLQIFRNVNVLSFWNNKGLSILIVVEEGLNLLPILSPHQHEKKYGHNTIWYTLSMKIDFNNFRGRQELFWIEGELWDKKSIGFGWQQPTTSPTYFWFNFLASSWPAQFLDYDGKGLLAEFGAGQKLIRNVRGYFRTSYHNIITDSAGIIDEFLFPRLGIGLFYDTRKPAYRYQEGILLAAGMDQYGGVTSNRVDFTAGYTSASFYQKLPFAPHYLVLFGNAEKRFDQTPYIYRLYGGGESTVRGYSPGSLEGDNRITGSLEYRYAVWKTPFIKLPYFDYFVPALARMYGILEVAAFADAGIYWNLNENMSDHLVEYGSGIGLRGWVPPLQRSGNIDLAWNRHGEYRVHLYLDIEF